MYEKPRITTPSYPSFTTTSLSIHGKQLENWTNSIHKVTFSKLCMNGSN